MKKTALIIGLIITTFVGKGQNLVPNGDLEQYSTCPGSVSQIDSALYWTNPCLPPYGTTGTASGSSDYFNTCATNQNAGVPYNSWGYQPAHSGNGYAGFYAYYSGYSFHEFIEVTLSSPLTANTCYHLQLYANIGNTSTYAIDTVGIYFSNTLVTGFHTHDTLPFIPQLKLNSGFISDTLNWILLSGTYTATGGESYITIGNFNSDANTNLLQIISTGTGLSYLYIDDVSLTPCTGIEEQNQNEAFSIYPNPVKDELNISGLPGEEEIIITDILGKEILRKQYQTTNFKLQTSNYLAGIYFVEINNGKNIFRKKFLKE